MLRNGNSPVVLGLKYHFSDLSKSGAYAKPMTFQSAETGKENRKRASDSFGSPAKKLKSLPDTPKAEKRKKSIFSKFQDA